MKRHIMHSVFGLIVATVGLFAAPASSRAQTGAPQDDEFNSSSFAAPFTVRCGANVFPTTCPDQQGIGTWSLDSVSPGNLRIDTQPGTLLGSANNARNFVVQPYNPSIDFTVTTKMTFPAIASNSTPLGQTAGLIAYLSDDNFIWVARTYPTMTTTGSQLQFGIEVNGVDTVAPNVSEGALVPATVYLQLKKAANLYTASYSYDNVTFTPFFANSMAQVFTADYAGGQPQVGVFAWGGMNAAVVQNILPADFDWFRSGVATIEAGAGWNLVGGSPLTLWSDSLVNWSWNAATGQWSHPTGTEPAGTGTWEEVSTAAARTVTVQVCPSPVTVSVVAHRWNMVGNPCDRSVSLPSSAQALWWNPTTKAYVPVTTINPGAAAWVKPAGSYLTLS